MIEFKQRLSRKDKIKIIGLLSELPRDEFNDFYITKNLMRLFVLENPNILFKCLNKGDYIFFDENGVLLVIGFSDKHDRKYVKVLAKDLKNADRLLKVLNWNFKRELWAKIKRNNPLKRVFESNGFYEYKGRGNEVLLRKKSRIGEQDGFIEYKDKEENLNVNK